MPSSIGPVVAPEFCELQPTEVTKLPLHFANCVFVKDDSFKRVHTDYWFLFT